MNYLPYVTEQLPNYNHIHSSLILILSLSGTENKLRVMHIPNSYLLPLKISLRTFTNLHNNLGHYAKDKFKRRHRNREWQILLLCQTPQVRRFFNLMKSTRHSCLPAFSIDSSIRYKAHFAHKEMTDDSFKNQKEIAKQVEFSRQKFQSQH